MRNDSRCMSCPFSLVACYERLNQVPLRVLTLTVPGHDKRSRHQIITPELVYSDISNYCSAGIIKEEKCITEISPVVGARVNWLEGCHWPLSVTKQKHKTLDCHQSKWRKILWGLWTVPDEDQDIPSNVKMSKYLVHKVQSWPSLLFK